MDASVQSPVSKSRNYFGKKQTKVANTTKKSIDNINIHKLTLQNNYLNNKIKYLKLKNNNKKLDLKKEKQHDWATSSHSGLYGTIMFSVFVICASVVSIVCVL